jgi:hypothetical protein
MMFLLSHLAPMIRCIFSGAKNSGTGTVPAQVPRKMASYMAERLPSVLMFDTPYHRRCALAYPPVTLFYGANEQLRFLLLRGWFPEGFDTKDLQEAKALIDSPASSVWDLLSKRGKRQKFQILTLKS